MYKLSGTFPMSFGTALTLFIVVDNSGTFLPVFPPYIIGRQWDVNDSLRRLIREWRMDREHGVYIVRVQTNPMNASQQMMDPSSYPENLLRFATLLVHSVLTLQGYRRSFDIGGTSPILGPRLSLDSTPSNRNISISSRTESRLRVSSIPGKVEERAPTDAPFEDIKLEDDRPSRKNLLSRFGFGARVPKRKDGVSGEELQNIEIDD